MKSSSEITGGFLRSGLLLSAEDNPDAAKHGYRSARRQKGATADRKFGVAVKRDWPKGLRSELPAAVVWCRRELPGGVVMPIQEIINLAKQFEIVANFIASP